MLRWLRTKTVGDRPRETVSCERSRVAASAGWHRPLQLYRAGRADLFCKSAALAMNKRRSASCAGRDEKRALTRPRRGRSREEIGMDMNTRLPGFTAELSIRDRRRTRFSTLGRPKSACWAIAPQLFAPPHTFPCPWPPCVRDSHGDCVCFFNFF